MMMMMMAKAEELVKERLKDEASEPDRSFSAAVSNG